MIDLVYARILYDNPKRCELLSAESGQAVRRRIDGGIVYAFVGFVDG